jgi:hypothetical protein
LAHVVPKRSPCAAGVEGSTPITADVDNAGALDPPADRPAAVDAMGNRSKRNIVETEVVSVDGDGLGSVTVGAYDDRSSASCEVAAIGTAVGVKS